MRKSGGGRGPARAKERKGAFFKIEALSGEPIFY